MTYGKLILKLQHAPESPGSLNQTQIFALHSQNFWLKESGVVLIICFSKKFIKLMLLVGVLHYENHWSRRKKSPLVDSDYGTEKFFNQLTCNLPDFGVFKYHIVCCQNTHQMDSFVLFKKVFLDQAQNLQLWIETRVYWWWELTAILMIYLLSSLASHLVAWQAMWPEISTAIF